VGNPLEIGAGVDAEDEADSILIPAFEMLRLGEVGVAPLGDLAESALAAQGDRPVELAIGVRVRGSVTTPVGQEPRHTSVGQRDQQRMVVSYSIVRDVHALLAPAVGGSEYSVGVDEGLVEEGVGLLLPDPESGLVDGFHQPIDSVFSKAAAEVSGGGGVGDASGPECVEVDLVIASDFEVLDATAAGQKVVRDVEDVVALVRGQVPLEQVGVPIDVVDEADLAGQEVDGTEAAGGDGPGAKGDCDGRSRSGCWRRPSSAAVPRHRADSGGLGRFSACVD
jgi:hypothetical protein